MSFPSSVNITSINGTAYNPDIVCETLQCSVKLYAPTVETDNIEAGNIVVDTITPMNEDLNIGGGVNVINGNINILGVGNFYINGVPVSNGGGSIPDPLPINTLKVDNIETLISGNIQFNSDVRIPNAILSSNILYCNLLGCHEIQSDGPIQTLGQGSFLQGITTKEINTETGNLKINSNLDMTQNIISNVSVISNDADASIEIKAKYGIYLGADDPVYGQSSFTLDDAPVPFDPSKSCATLSGCNLRFNGGSIYSFTEILSASLIAPVKIGTTSLFGSEVDCTIQSSKDLYLTCLNPLKEIKANNNLNMTNKDITNVRNLTNTIDNAISVSLPGGGGFQLINDTSLDLYGSTITGTQRIRYNNDIQFLDLSDNPKGSIDSSGVLSFQGLNCNNNQVINSNLQPSKSYMVGYRTNDFTPSGANVSEPVGFDVFDSVDFNQNTPEDFQYVGVNSKKFIFEVVYHVFVGTDDDSFGCEIGINGGFITNSGTQIGHVKKDQLTGISKIIYTLNNGDSFRIFGFNTASNSYAYTVNTPNLVQPSFVLTVTEI